MNPSTYKYCIVPCCTNTTISSREKLFFLVPKDSIKRKAWTTAMKRDDKLNKKLSPASSLYCCEDHFSLPDDMENYWQWKLTQNVKRLQLKSNVVPHIFNCQQKNVQPSAERIAAKKRKHMHLIQDALSDFGTSSNRSDDELGQNNDVSSVPLAIVSDTTDNFLDKAIQVNIKKPFRSRGSNTSIKMTSVGCSTSNMNVTVGTSISPGKLSQDIDESLERHCNKDTFDLSSDFDSSDAEESIDEDGSSDEDVEKSRFKEHMVTGTIMSIEKEPKLFLGIPKKSFYLIQLLADKTKLPVNHIYIVLKKIRINTSFAILGMDFGLSTTSVCRIFLKSLPMIASLMQELIVWPDVRAVQAHLPIPFRARYGKVTSIIDCLEIQIEKPSDPVPQALTWSSYYNCNTLKYLVSCTPDGLVSFVSEGFGGRASDVIIVENSGYLNKLVAGTCIMADRGFKNISNLLQQKNCTLIRPPSVSSETKSTKMEVKESKRIASLRIHVERVIRRLREFKMLGPHACVDRHHTSLIDLIIITACGIINMQDHLIKT